MGLSSQGRGNSTESIRHIELPQSTLIVPLGFPSAKYLVKMYVILRKFSSTFPSHSTVCSSPMFLGIKYLIVEV